MKINIFLNSIHKVEKEYILSVLFTDILGFEINFNYDELINDYVILLPNKKKLIISDIFFQSEKNQLKWENYNYPDSASEQLVTINNNEHNLFCLYGDPECSINSDIIKIKNDIIGTSFVFLSRIEELNDNHDKFGRYKYSNSIAERFDIITRPVINEYIEFLKESIQYIDPNCQFKENKFKILLTHDIDTIKKWTWKHFFKHIIFNFGKVDYLKNYLAFFRTQLNQKSDPYYNFEKIMNISESYGLESTFLFMALEKNEFDCRYSLNEIEAAVDQINSRKKHKIGIHVSRIAYNNLNNASREIDRLEKLTKSKNKYNRQHYLMFDVRNTWKILEENKIQYDLTLGYPEMPGFKCGICYPFHVFDIVNKKKLNLIEIPLIIMDVSLMDYLKNIDFEDELNKILKNIKKYDGTLNILWHNDQFEDSNFIKNKILFEKIINI